MGGGHEGVWGVDEEGNMEQGGGSSAWGRGGIGGVAGAGTGRQVGWGGGGGEGRRRIMGGGQGWEWGSFHEAQQG